MSVNVLLGVDGTAHGVRERARFFGRNAQVPLMIIAVGRAPRSARACPRSLDCWNARCSRWSASALQGRRRSACRAPARVGPTTGLGTWVKLMVHADQDTRHAGRPLYVEIVRRLRRPGPAARPSFTGSGARRAAATRGQAPLAPASRPDDHDRRRHTGADRRWFAIIDEPPTRPASSPRARARLPARGEWARPAGWDSPTHPRELTPVRPSRVLNPRSLPSPSLPPPPPLLPPPPPSPPSSLPPPPPPSLSALPEARRYAVGGVATGARSGAQRRRAAEAAACGDVLDRQFGRLQQLWAARVR